MLESKKVIFLLEKLHQREKTDPTPEEKLLRAIFGEKAGEVKDASKRAEPGIKGVLLKLSFLKNKQKELKKLKRENKILTFKKKLQITRKIN